MYVSDHPVSAFLFDILSFAIVERQEYVGFVEFGYGFALQCSVPIVVVGDVSTKAIQAALMAAGNSTLLLNITGDDGITPFRSFMISGWFWFFQIFMAVSSCAVACVAFIKLWNSKLTFRMLIRIQQPLIPVVHSPSFPALIGPFPALDVNSICLILELLGAFIRFLSWGIDPLGARQLTSAPLQSVSRTASIPLTIASTLFFTMYLHETIRKSTLRVSDGGGYLRIPAAVLAVVVCIIEIVLDAVYLADPLVPFQARTWNALLYGFICIGLSVYFFVIAVKIVQALRLVTDATSTTKSTRRFRLICVGLFVVGASLILFGINAFVALAPFYAASPFSHVGVIVFWILAHTWQNAKGIATVLMFRQSKSQNLASANIDVGRSDVAGSSMAVFSPSTRDVDNL